MRSEPSGPCSGLVPQARGTRAASRRTVGRPLRAFEHSLWAPRMAVPLVGPSAELWAQLLLVQLSGSLSVHA